MTRVLNETAAEDVVARLTSKTDLVDVMIDLEDYLDNSSLYAFDNWIKGVMVQGPTVKKYWIEFTLKYDYEKMPDPSGALRLTIHGTKVTYQKAHERIPLPINSPADYLPGTRRPRMKKVPIWLVHFKIPRRFVEALDQELLDTYSDEMDDSDQNNIEDTVTQGQTNGLT
jgi:hypothetical protein